MKKIGLVFLVVLFAMGCAKWVSIDISEDSVVLISPVENQSDSLQNKMFIWEELEGAKKYRLQIVSANFDSILDYVLDSAVSATSYSISLIPNEYEWRVRGENDDFNSLWSTRKLTIESTASLANQEISGVSPVNGFNTNQMTQTFTWNPLVSADYYTITVDNEAGTEIEVSNTTTEEYSYTFAEEGLFTVNIKAINDISASITYENSIRIDTTAPSDVTLTFPVNDTLTSFPQTFTWTIDSSNQGSAITDTLIIASDSLMNNVLLDTAFLSTTSLSLDEIESASGKVYWKLNRGDAAGNSNTTMPSKSFHIE